MLQALLGFIPALIKGGFNLANEKVEAKKLKQTAEAKLKLKKETNDTNIELTDAEWESLGQKGLSDSWKDEYVTLIVTAPIVSVLVGAVWNAFTGNSALLTGTLDGIEKLTLLGLNWDVLTTAVVLAAVGLKIWRSM